MKPKKTIENIDSKYLDLIESDAVGIIIFNDNNIVVFANQKACKITGYSKSEFTKLNFWDLAIDKDIIKGRGRKRLKNEDVTEHFEIQIQHKKGHTIWIDYVGKKIDWLGEPAVMISAFDLTKQKKLNNN